MYCPFCKFPWISAWGLISITYDYLFLEITQWLDPVDMRSRGYISQQVLLDEDPFPLESHWFEPLANLFQHFSDPYIFETFPSYMQINQLIKDSNYKQYDLYEKRSE